MPCDISVYRFFTVYTFLRQSDCIGHMLTTGSTIHSAIKVPNVLLLTLLNTTALVIHELIQCRRAVSTIGNTGFWSIKYSLFWNKHVLLETAALFHGYSSFPMLNMLLDWRQVTSSL